VKQVFVSASSTGLRSYRALATEVISAQGINAVVQEHFPVPDQDIAEVIKEKIYSSDGVLALVGPYYGYPSPFSRSGSRRSYSQYEIEYALGQKVPCRALIATRECELDPAESESQDCVESQRRFVENLMARIGPRFGWTTFGNKLEFAIALAKIRWSQWIG
jgi:hypothetical protein